jgi:hypothetical protein
MLDKAVAVRAVSKRHIQQFGISDGLLHARSHGVIVVFGFDDRQRNIRLVIENVIRALLCAARIEFASHEDATLGERYFFSNLRIAIPACNINKRGCDELCADIAFAESFPVGDVQLVWPLPGFARFGVYPNAVPGNVGLFHNSFLIDRRRWAIVGNVPATGRYGATRRERFCHPEFFDQLLTGSNFGRAGLCQRARIPDDLCENCPALLIDWNLDGRRQRGALYSG